RRSTLDKAKEELRKAKEWPRVPPGEPDKWVLAPDQPDYPKSKVLSRPEMEVALATFLVERNTGFIPKSLYEADERRKREIIRQAVKAKKLRRKKESLARLQRRLSMTPRQLRSAVFDTPIST